MYTASNKSFLSHDFNANHGGNVTLQSKRLATA